ncbi:MAG: AAA15 family ATPase/GTPase [Flammeovirgaceae bacterium]|jgi:AAA15 family ATPase/GTPase
MIHEFKVSNFLSFKDEQVLSFEATSDNSYEDLYCVEKSPSIKLLKLGIVFGANASGKSNLLSALDFLRTLVLNAEEDKFEEIHFAPFLLNEESRKEDTDFSLSFFIGKTRFIYSVSLNKSYISKEQLIYYPSRQPAELFNREFDVKDGISKITFGKKLEIGKKEQFALETSTIKNSTVLSIYMQKNIKIDLLDEVVKWFNTNLMRSVNPHTDLKIIAIKNLGGHKDFILNILKKADFNISDITIDDPKAIVDSSEWEFTHDFKSLINSYKLEEIVDFDLKVEKIRFEHKLKNGKFTLPYESQSQGTKRFLGFGTLLSILLSENNTLPIDELESSLHYELVNHFLKTFLANSTDSQLLFTTHNISILQEDFIRRDAVWFCEKNDEGATELFSASDFGLHKNTSLYNAYRIGKLGAKPETGSVYLDSHNG